MARRIVISDGTFCSSCGSAVERRAGLCFSCGQPFEGDIAGTKCPSCGRAVEGQAAQCPVCGTNLLAPARPPATPATPEGLVEEMKTFRQGGAGGTDPAARPEETEQSLLMELESIWKGSAPFEQVVAARRKRLEQMDRLITAARRRIRELEGGTSPAEVREREELKRQVQEVLLEREEILKIEFGIAEMERIYRNVITTQQKELHAKEDALKARLEGFRKEIGMRDAEREAVAERERELERRESDLEAKLASLRTKADAPSPQPRESSETPKSPDGEGVTREQWLAAQHEIQNALLNLRGTGSELVLPTAEGLRDLRMRVSELEEALEKA